MFQASLGYLRLSQNKQKQTRINKQTKEGRKVLLFVNMKVKFTSKTLGGPGRDTYQGSQHLETVAGGLGYIRSHHELISELKTGLDYIVEPRLQRQTRGKQI